jgi:hypothetical protein
MWYDLFISFVENGFIYELLELFSSLFKSIQPVFDHVQLLFDISIYLLSFLYLHHLEVQYMVWQFVCTLSAVFHCHCQFFLAVPRLLITFRPPSQDFLFIAYYVYITFLMSISNVCSFIPFFYYSLTSKIPFV